MFGDDVAGDAQTKPRPLSHIPGREERLENLLSQFGGDTVAVVGNLT